MEKAKSFVTKLYLVSQTAVNIVQVLVSVIRPPYQQIQGRQRYHHVSLFFPRAKKMFLLLPLRMPQNPMKLMTRKFILRNLKMLVWLNGWRLYRIAMATSPKHDIKKNPTMYKLRVVIVTPAMVKILPCSENHRDYPYCKDKEDI